MRVFIPKKLKVAGRTYKVIFPCDIKDRDDCKGLHHGGYQEIKISKSCAGEHEYHEESPEQTFIHEMIHSINAVYMNYKLCEESVTHLAEGLYQVLKDNEFIKGGTCKCKEKK